MGFMYYQMNKSHVTVVVSPLFSDAIIFVCIKGYVLWPGQTLKEESRNITYLQFMHKNMLYSVMCVSSQCIFFLW